MALPDSVLFVDGEGGGGDFFGLPVPPTDVVQSSAPPAPVSASTAPLVSGLGFDVSPSAIAAAQARGNTRADILSAHQTFVSGVPTGRGGQYAISNMGRFGFSTIREGAASYLEAAGLRRLAKVIMPGPRIDPEPAPDDSGIVTQSEPIGEGNPFATLGQLVEVFERVFAVASPSDSPAPVVVVGDATQSQAQGSGGGGSAAIILIVLAIGAGALYWFYLRKKGASNG